MQTEAAGVLSREDAERLEKIIEHAGGSKDSIINILNETQEAFGYLPYSAQKFIAEKLDVPLAEIYGIATFYSRFTLTPVGKYKISVCLGTACYVKNAQNVLEKIEEKIGIKAGETSEDGMYSIAATRCIGACGLAPIITVNEDVYGKIVPEDVEGILEKYK